jgi:outer membrane protein OmpA-like peptidoglycan-associated protein
MKNQKLKITLLLLFAGLFCLTVKSQNNNQIQSKFDFIPGEKVIFFDDFTTENIGDFPAQWTTNGSGEIVTTSNFPGRWFQITKAGYYIPDVDPEFTENFTVEFDIVASNIVNSETAVGISFFILSGDRKNPGYGSQPGTSGIKIYPDYQNIFWNNWSEAREWQGENGSVEFTIKSTEKYHMSVWVQKQRVRVYMNENKILDLPNGLHKGYTYNIFRIETTGDTNPLISNFRIAGGLSDMRNKLITEGKLISYGIQFDVNSDKVKPESYATIKEIAQVLKDNPTVKVKVLGHTDSDGEDAKNLDLSKRRAISVKNELTTKFAIDASRIETDGKGETEPVAKNDSQLSKAKNRRVEFIKL